MDDNGSGGCFEVVHGQKRLLVVSLLTHTTRGWMHCLGQQRISTMMQQHCTRDYAAVWCVWWWYGGACVARGWCVEERPRLVCKTIHTSSNHIKSTSYQIITYLPFINMSGDAPQGHPAADHAADQQVNEPSTSAQAEAEARQQANASLVHQLLDSLSIKVGCTCCSTEAVLLDDGMLIPCTKATLSIAAASLLQASGRHAPKDHAFWKTQPVPQNLANNDEVR